MVLDEHFMLMVCGVALAAAAGMETVQLPDPLAVALNAAEFQLAETVILNEGVAFPQIFKGLSRCTTILLCSTLFTERLEEEGVTTRGATGFTLLLSFLQLLRIKSDKSTSSSHFSFINR